MRFILALVIISALFSLASFGPSFTAHGVDHAENCPVSTLTGSPCQTLGNVLGHLSAMSNSFQGVAQHSGVMMILLGAILTMAVVSRMVTLPSMPSVSLFRIWHDMRSATQSSLVAYDRWNSLLVHSPTVV